MQADRVSQAAAQGEEEAIERAIRPKRLEEYIGQRQVKAQLEIFVRAARQRGEALDHVLIFGPPGLGKTTLAHIVAAELGVNLRQTSGPGIARPCSPTCSHAMCCSSTRSTGWPRWWRKCSTRRWRTISST